MMAGYYWNSIMRELDQKMIIWINLTHLASVNKAMGSSPSDLRE